MTRHTGAALAMTFAWLVYLQSLVAADYPDVESLKPVKLFDTSHYCEGVVFDHAGAGYVSVCAGKSILKFTLDGHTQDWATSPEPNGHRVLADGTHLVCDAPSHAVLRFSADGKPLKPAATECNGKPLRGPNDLALDAPNGGFYFTDPGGGSGIDNPIGTLHYVDAQGKCSELDGGFAYSNGVVLRPDGSELLMAESQKNRILAYKVEGPGKLAARRVFAKLPVKDPAKGQIDNQPDGMCLDAAGNLYVAHYGMRQVQVLSPSGKLLASLPAGVLTTSNVAFGGPDMTQLFITGGVAKEAGAGGVYRLDLGVKGLKILPKRSS